MSSTGESKCLVCRGVLGRELDLRHVLLEPPHHRQLEEGLGEELHLVADLGPDEAVCLQHQELHLTNGGALVGGRGALGRARGEGGGAGLPAAS